MSAVSVPDDPNVEVAASGAIAGLGAAGDVAVFGRNVVLVVVVKEPAVGDGCLCRGRASNDAGRSSAAP